MMNWAKFSGFVQIKDSLSYLDVDIETTTSLFQVSIDEVGLSVKIYICDLFPSVPASLYFYLRKKDEALQSEHVGSKHALEAWFC